MNNIKEIIAVYAHEHREMPMSEDNLKKVLLQMVRDICNLDEPERDDLSDTMQQFVKDSEEKAIRDFAKFTGKSTEALAEIYIKQLDLVSNN